MSQGTRFQSIPLPSELEDKKTETEVRKMGLELLKQINTIYFELMPVSGNTDRGDFIKFPEGTMICSGTASVTTNSSFSGFFFAGTETLVTFPEVFTAAPHVTVTLVDVVGSIGAAFVSNRSGTHPVTASSFGVNVMTSNNSAVFIIHWIARGNWK